MIFWATLYNGVQCLARLSRLFVCFGAVTPLSSLCSNSQESDTNAVRPAHAACSSYCLCWRYLQHENFIRIVNHSYVSCWGIVAQSRRLEWKQLSTRGVMCVLTDPWALPSPPIPLSPPIITPLHLFHSSNNLLYYSILENKTKPSLKFRRGGGSRRSRGHRPRRAGPAGSRGSGGSRS